MKHCRSLLIVATALLLLAMAPGIAGASPDKPGTDLAQMLMRWPTHPNSTTTPGPSPVLPTSLSDVTPNCRSGAAIFSPTQAAWLPKLGAGWYSNLWVDDSPGAAPARAARLIAMQQNKSGCQYLSGYTVNPKLDENGLGQRVRANPGALWLVGNEPDRGPNPDNCLHRVQSDSFPEVYAQAYHDVYTFIKKIDPTAQVANGALAEMTPGRLQYLDRVWQAYARQYGVTWPVDVWNTHIYVLPEALPSGQPDGIANIAVGTDPALAIRESGNNKANCGLPGIYCWADHDNINAFKGQILALRGWMKAHNQQNKPLVITEFSILFPFQDYDDPINPTRCYLMDEYGKCFTQARVSAHLDKTFQYLSTASDTSLGYPKDHYRLVQQWLWWSINYSGGGSVSNLTTSDLLALSEPGTHFRAFAENQLPQINLFPELTRGTISGIAHGGQNTGSVVLTVDVRNNGDSVARPPFAVTFYADNGLTQAIGTATIAAGPPGCATSVVRASVPWSGLSVGTHSYWVKADSANAVSEQDKSDNVASGLVRILPNWLLLPLSRR